MEDIFFSESGEALEQVAQRGSGGPVPGNIHGQVGWSSEQCGLVEDVPCSLLLTSVGPFQPKAFCDVRDFVIVIHFLGKFLMRL